MQLISQISDLRKRISQMLITDLSCQRVGENLCDEPKAIEDHVRPFTFGTHGAE